MSGIDILTETWAVEDLYENGGHPNLIEIKTHGWLPFSSDYYLDMELCAYNLDDWIRGNESFHQGTETMAYRSYDPRRWRSNLWDAVEDGVNILMNVVSGLEFIHGRKLVHRDLNPRNSYSTLFAKLIL